jgi:glycosyltransferase involved in cell wall biosynthesis
MKDIISIISPAFNVEKCIDKCIESVICQTNPNFEHIIINDGSTDQTLSIIQKYSALDKRIKIINLPASGVTIARKTGVEAAEGNYFYFLDSDDYLPETALSELFNKIISDKSEIVVGGYTEIGLDGAIRNSSDTPNSIISSEEYLILILNSSNQGLCGKLFKRELFENKISFPFDLFYGEDFNILIQVVSFAKRISFLPKSVFYYVRRKNSLTNSNSEKLSNMYYDRVLFLDSIIDNLQIAEKVRLELIIEVIKGLYPYIRMNKQIEHYRNIKSVVKYRFKDSKTREKIRKKKLTYWFYINIYLHFPILLNFYNKMSNMKNHPICIK